MIESLLNVSTGVGLVTDVRVGFSAGESSAWIGVDLSPDGSTGNVRAILVGEGAGLAILENCEQLAMYLQVDVRPVAENDHSTDGGAGGNGKNIRVDFPASTGRDYWLDVEIAPGGSTGNLEAVMVGKSAGQEARQSAQVLAGFLDVPVSPGDQSPGRGTGP
ncbi:MAG TPA: hypothetical protein VF069_03840 [Streptosporangiaceae bacterium]